MHFCILKKRKQFVLYLCAIVWLVRALISVLKIYIFALFHDFWPDPEAKNATDPAPQHCLFPFLE